MNNYNISSTGENIDFHVFYDTTLAQIYFEEWLNGADGTQVSQIKLGRDSNLYLIGESEAPYFKKSELLKMNKSELYDIWYGMEFGYCYDYEVKKGDLINDLLSVTIKRYYEYLASQGETDNGKYKMYVTCGYSQGDYAEYCYIGDMPDWYKNYIHNIFWDCPISIRAEINGREYYEDSFLGDNYYEWDIEAVKARVMAWDDCSDYAKNWIVEHLPEYPDYS